MHNNVAVALIVCLLLFIVLCVLRTYSGNIQGYFSVVTVSILMMTRRMLVHIISVTFLAGFWLCHQSRECKTTEVLGLGVSWVVYLTEVCWIETLTWKQWIEESSLEYQDVASYHLFLHKGLCLSVWLKLLLGAVGILFFVFGPSSSHMWVDVVFPAQFCPWGYFLCCIGLDCNAGYRYLPCVKSGQQNGKTAFILLVETLLWNILLKSGALEGQEILKR